MRVWPIVIGVAALGLTILIGLLVRSHAAWLDQQTPAGIWRSTTGEAGEVLLAFKGGPREGTYLQLTKHGDKRLREFGHWAAQRRQLSMLIMATDMPDHPRFGLATPYDLIYLSDTRIRISGPDRPEMVYDRMDATLELERELSVGEPPN